MGVAADVATQLVTRLTAIGVTGMTAANVRPERVKPASANSSLTNAIPHRCIFVMETQGLADVPYCDADGKNLSTGVQGTKSGVVTLGVQVAIRGARADEAGTRTLAENVVTALRWYPPSGYADIEVVGGGANGPFEDGTQSWVATVNLLLWKRLG